MLRAFIVVANAYLRKLTWLLWGLMSLARSNRHAAMTGRVRTAIEDAAVQFAATLSLEQSTQLAISERNLHGGLGNR
jgi:hypothetical protein